MSEIAQQVKSQQEEQAGNNGGGAAPRRGDSVDAPKRELLTKDDVLAKYARTYQLVHLALHLIWLHFHVKVFGRFVMSFIFGSWSPTNRKIAIVGDDLAVGVGDWVLIGREPGLQGRLNAVLNRDQSTRLIGRGVLWTALTAAKAGSTSADWVPVSLMTKEQQKAFAARNRVDTAAQAKGASLFDQAFNGRLGSMRDADVVVLVVGSKDRCPMTETAENIRKTTTALMHLGKSVVVCTIPLGLSALAVQGVPALFRERNLLCHQLVRSLHASDVSEGSFKTVGPGAREEDDTRRRGFTAKHQTDGVLDDGHYDPANYSNVQPRESCTRIVIAPIAENLTKEIYHRFGGKTLSGAGYTRAGEVILEALTPTLRTIDGKRAWIPHQ